MTDEQRLEWASAPQEFRTAHEQAMQELKDEREKNAALDKEVMGVRRERTFTQAFEQVKDRLPEGTSISLEDLGPDTPLDQITPTLIELRVADKKKASDEAELKFAKDLGFQSVEEYRTFRQSREQQIAANRQELETQGSVAGIRSGTEGLNLEQTPQEAALEAFQAARKKNLPEDVAREEYARIIREKTTPAPAGQNE